MKSVYLLGVAGQMNFGDELITVEWIRYLNRCFPETSVFVEAVDPSVTSMYLGGHGLRAYPVKRIWDPDRTRNLGWLASNQGKLLRKFIPWTLEERIRQERDLVATLLAEPAKAEAFTTMLKAIDVVHLIGGGYLCGRFPCDAGLLLGAAVALKESLGVKCYASGLSVSPLSPSSAAAAIRVFSHFDTVELRDPESLAYFESRENPSTAFLGLDDTFLHRIREEEREHSHPVLHLNVQTDHIEADDFDGLVENIVRFIDEHWRAFSEIRCYILAPPSDELFVSRVATNTKAANLRRVPFQEALQRGLRGRRGDLAVVTRFHAHLMLSRSGVRGCYIDFMGDMYSIKHRSVVSLGSNWKQLTTNENIRFDIFPSVDPSFDEEGLHGRKLAYAHDIYGDRLGCPET